MWTLALTTNKPPIENAPDLHRGFRSESDAVIRPRLDALDRCATDRTPIRFRPTGRRGIRPYPMSNASPQVTGR